MEHVLVHNQSESGLLRLSYTDGYYRADIGDGNRVASIIVPDHDIPDGDVRFALRWDETEFALLADGQVVGVVANPPLPSELDETTWLGCDSDGNQWDGALGPARLSSRPRTDAELAGEGLADADTIAIYALDGVLGSGIVSAELTDASFGGHLARGLFEGKRQNTSDSPFLHYPTSLLWAELKAVGWIIDEQTEHRELAESQLYLPSSSGDWLDYWGWGRFGVPRYDGETDSTYAARVINELIRPTQNNKALELILKDALGIDAEIVDAWPNRESLAPEDQQKAPGHFLLDMRIPNDMAPEDAQALIDQAKDVVRRYKAGGTDFLETVLRQLVGVTESQAVSESLSVLLTAVFEDSFQPGPVYCGAGWYSGCPDLYSGANDAIKEQAAVRVLNAADDTVAESYLYGG